MDAINPKVDPYLLSQLFTICDLRNLLSSISRSLVCHYHLHSLSRFTPRSFKVQATFHGRSRNTLDPYLALDLLYNYLSIT
jgi:hypothetical protein